jgi:hypothetical protein
LRYFGRLTDPIASSQSGHEQFQTQNTNSTIVGARNAKQVEGNVDATTLRLTTKEITEIEGKNEREPELITAACRKKQK